MIVLDPRQAASAAVSHTPGRPATATIRDADDARHVVFRLAAGQVVPLHRSTSSVHVIVLQGPAVLIGEAEGASVERVCGPGTLVVYQPNELHGFRALAEEVQLLAMITPRPGAR